MNYDVRKYVPIKSSNLLVLNAPRASAGLAKTESPGRIPADDSNSHGRGKKRIEFFSRFWPLKG